MLHVAALRGYVLPQSPVQPSGLLVPAAQARHAESPRTAEYVPTGHRACRPLTQKAPLLHVAQMAPALRYLPGAHWVQLVAVTMPLGQPRQLEPPALEV